MNERMKLFCFPYSGTSSSYYLSWQRFLPNSVQICPVEYPGRGKLFNEAFCASMKELIGAVYNQIREEIDESPYALFGHSLGGLVSYEFVRLLSGYDKRMPLHVFISGATPPHIKYGDETLHTLPDYEFVREIVKLGGMSEEVINNRELMTLYTPIIRADYKIYETYVCGDNSPLDTDMTVFAGDDDQLLMRADPAQWKRYTTKNFKLKLYKGGHFFIHRYCPDVMAAIYTELVGGIPSDDMALMGAGGAVTYHD